ncbi:ATP-binding cassette domain-containing protein [bacterium]|nr:ATP-binding cassette domain-containing protein [bacterium]
MSETLLQVRDLSLAFGGLKAVDGFQLTLPKGSLQALIGPNGAGKTTIFNLLTGVYRPDSGEIRLGDRSLVGLRPFQVARAGVSRTFQNIRLFSDLTVMDNILVATQMRLRHGLFAAVFRTGHHLGEEAAAHRYAEELLEVMDLRGQASEYARNLPYGHQRRLEIARALATQPQLLLLDEPAAGMNTGEKRELETLIRDIRDRFKVTILLIEHDMSLVMNVCERITVVDHGVVIAEGEPEEIRANPRVIEAYLGTNEE